MNFGMGRESREQLLERVRRIIGLFKSHYPDAHCALDHKNPEELLVATILSAQCTDARVNMVTPELFKTYPSMRDLAGAPLEEIERLVRSTGFFRNKAKNIQATAKELCTNHQCRVPRDFAAVCKLPGVGRKTANVVLGNAFQMSTGVVVDTHVGRLSHRLGFSSAKTAEKIEQDLMGLVPQEDWIQFSHWLITHGRAICQARKASCQQCFLEERCPKKIQVAQSGRKKESDLRARLKRK